MNGKSVSDVVFGGWLTWRSPDGPPGAPVLVELAALISNYSAANEPRPALLRPAPPRHASRRDQCVLELYFGMECS